MKTSTLPAPKTISRPEIEAIKAHLVPYLEAMDCVLKKSGKSQECLCPLHDEKTPSFQISFKDNHPLWYCFGCRQGGDLITLHALLHGYHPKDDFGRLRTTSDDFGRITAELGEQFGIPVSAAPGSQPQRSVARKAEKQARLRAKRERREALLYRAAHSQLADILARYPSPDWRKMFEEASPTKLGSDPSRHRAMMLECLFPGDSTIFIGDVWDSGEEGGIGHFQTVHQWQRYQALPGPRIAAATFPPGCVSRTKESVETTPYLILESDELIGHKPTNAAECEANKAASAALIRWCVRELHMKLAAVVDTGHRSLHGWFCMPENPSMLAELRAIAPALRLDPNLFDHPNAPVRLPGALHEKNQQRASLHYLTMLE